MREERKMADGTSQRRISKAAEPSAGENDVNNDSVDLQPCGQNYVLDFC
jgi:hypothetical protein